MVVFSCRPLVYSFFVPSLQLPTSTSTSSSSATATTAAHGKIKLCVRRVAPPRLRLPGFAVERAHGSRLEPLVDAVLVEGVAALPPQHVARLGGVGGGGLAEDAGAFHEIPTDAAHARLARPAGGKDGEESLHLKNFLPLSLRCVHRRCPCLLGAARVRILVITIIIIIAVVVTITTTYASSSSSLWL